MEENMEINLLTVIVLLVLLLYAVRGYRKGFVKTLASMFFLAVAMVAVYFATPYVRDFLMEQTPVYSFIEGKCEELVGNVGSEFLTDAGAQEEYIQSLKLPDILKEQLIENNNAENYASLAVTNFREYLSGFLTNGLLTILVYVVTFLIVWIILSVAVAALGAAAKLPVLSGINRILGFVLGTAQGVLVIWIAFLVLTLLSGTDGGRKLLNMVYESEVLAYLYDANIFLKVLL